ncbi:M20/M25/M40 family metallo-hydrolase [Herbidospora sp. NEAU-GS84]|uniref:M20/M25/M40 family metallo-hydrolase n=1 Tax=Herbidospora solisilvae TaxID=2696284 RepID=A0A7C9N2T2_9ACTN|nr:M28 family peptidase [Herbidospora solisilvae]NAS23969.1 M20/M25/M40 family metallo-hydrolase [Herbidospora solisilvae]
MSADPGLDEAVTEPNVFAHVQVLAEIGNQHGNRAVGTAGYEASAQYVERVLTAAGYQVTSQPFTLPHHREVSPAVLTTAAGPVDAATFAFSPSGRVSGPVQETGTGCLSTDWTGFRQGSIAVAERGGCSFRVKADRAARAGAGALIVVNSRPGELKGSLGEPGTPLPVVGVAQDAAIEGPVTVETNTTSTMKVTRNVIAQTGQGDPDDVLILGAHLDSVEAGPGINDNGSGVGVVLEIAEQMARMRPDRAVRFAFWGAEEVGLVGSTHYVKNLSAEEKAKIAGYVNLDMVATENHGNGVYDSDNAIEEAATEFYRLRGLSSEEVAFDGRSDYGPFVKAGIPAGGIFTGADSIKTPEQAAVYGGTANRVFDPCYHKACDTIENVNRQVLDVSADAVAYIVEQLAFTDRPVR